MISPGSWHGGGQKRPKPRGRKGEHPNRGSIDEYKSCTRRVTNFGSRDFGGKVTQKCDMTQFRDDGHERRSKGGFTLARFRNVPARSSPGPRADEDPRSNHALEYGNLQTAIISKYHSYAKIADTTVRMNADELKWKFSRGSGSRNSLRSRENNSLYAGLFAAITEATRSTQSVSAPTSYHGSAGAPVPGHWLLVKQNLCLWEAPSYWSSPPPASGLAACEHSAGQL